MGRLLWVLVPRALGWGLPGLLRRRGVPLVATRLVLIAATGLVPRMWRRPRSLRRGHAAWWWLAWALALVTAVGVVVLATLPAGSGGGGGFQARVERASPSQALAAVPLVDLNRASRAELEALPGVGADRAAAIIVARAERPFTSLADAVERGVLPAAVAEELEGWVGVFEVEPAP